MYIIAPSIYDLGKNAFTNAGGVCSYLVKDLALKMSKYTG